jgi:DnaJ-class molecular chaperone
MRVRLKGQGEIGPGGGAPGDLYVELHEEPHRVFIGYGNDLHCTISILADESTVTTTGILGEPIEIPIRAGGSSEFAITLPGHGMPSLGTLDRGNLHVHVVNSRPPNSAAPQANSIQSGAAGDASEHSAWSTGEVVADLYEVIDVITSGGMGLVYRVHHREWDIDLAVKAPRPELAGR